MKIKKQKFSKYVKSDEIKYQEVYSDLKKKRTIDDRMRDKVLDGRLKVARFIAKKYKMYGRVMDAGGGTGWLSAELSKFSHIDEVVCLDLSERKITTVAPEIIKRIKGKEDKISLVVGDFHKFDFPDNYFDFIVFSAALHHVPEENYPVIFNELHRVLKRDGKIIAIREPIIPKLIFWRKWEVKRKEKKNKSTENIYSLKQWGKLFELNGFKFSYIPFVITNNKMNFMNYIRKFVKYTRIFNGWFFGYYVMVGDNYE